MIKWRVIDPITNIQWSNIIIILYISCICQKDGFLCVALCVSSNHLLQVPHHLQIVHMHQYINLCPYLTAHVCSTQCEHFHEKHGCKSVWHCVFVKNFMAAYVWSRTHLLKVYIHQYIYFILDSPHLLHPIMYTSMERWFLCVHCVCLPSSTLFKVQCISTLIYVLTWLPMSAPPNVFHENMGGPVWHCVFVTILFLVTHQFVFMFIWLPISVWCLVWELYGKMCAPVYHSVSNPVNPLVVLQLF